MPKRKATDNHYLDFIRVFCNNSKTKLTKEHNKLTMSSIKWKPFLSIHSRPTHTEPYDFERFPCHEPKAARLFH